MNKKEMYYKFIFPDYNNLSGSDSDSTPTSDGVDQTGEVRALCRACPSRVITYDQLSDNPDSSVSIYNNTNWPSSKKAEIKRYVDKWLTIPKYFNLRNYWDKDPPQEGGMSLMVSHTPEVGNAATDWAKFNGDSNKVVYCALMISSGDFFYNYCLPPDVLKKSGLLEEVFTSGFHSNWLINSNDITLYRTVPRAIHFNNSDAVYISRDPSTASYIRDSNYPGYPYSELSSFNSPSSVNPLERFEKRVFVQHYFTDYLQYGRHTTDDTIQHYYDFNEDLKRDFIELEATRRILYYNDGATLRNPDNGNIVTINSTSDIPILDDSLNTTMPSGAAQGYVWWSTTQQTEEDVPDPVKRMATPIQINVYNNGNWTETTVYTRAAYAANNCQYLREWTRQIAKQLKENLNRIGKNTQVSYEPPDVYRTDRGGCPPLQIPYNLLRYTMNDRPPFTDCETVLVMWVANGDPSAISDSAQDKVQQLHNLDWQQYAIPISVRCYYKEPEGNNRNCFERFLVQHPYYQSRLGLNSESPANHATYNYHYKFNEAYKKNLFQEALFLKDLLDYSQDYVIAYQLDSFIHNNNIFNAQKYLLEKRGSSSCKALYIRKRYVKVNNGLVPRSYRDFVSQAYYLNVPNSLYNINTNKTNYITDASDSTGNTAFVPSASKDPDDSSKYYFNKERFSKWDYLYDNGWGPVDDEHGNPVEVQAVYDNWLIALIDATGINQDSGKLTLVNNIVSGENQLKKFLNDNAPVDYCDWSDIYISSLGITPYNPFEDDAYLFNKSKNSDNGHTYPIGLLDGYIKIGSTTYGRSHNKVVVGFKKMYDYKYEDLYHFKYYTSDNTYKPVKVVYNYSSGNYQTTSVTGGFDCCAYTMNYPNP